MANESRSRAGGVAGALSAAVAAGDTSISSAGLADLAVVDTTKHAALTVYTADANGRVTKREVVWVTAHTAAATTATVVRAQEGTTAQAWAVGDKFVHGPTVRDVATGRLQFKTRTSGDVVMNATVFTAVDSALDLAVTAQAGDVISYGHSGFLSNETINTGFNVWTMNGGTQVNPLSVGSEGIGALFHVGPAFSESSGTVLYQVLAGDVFSGKVTLRLFYKANVAGNKSLRANTGLPFHLWAFNHGPVEA